jgi:hypothetical protein
MLIYAMKVKEALPFREFSTRYQKQADYYHNHKNKPRAGAPVLVSRYFYYFGDRAIRLPEPELSNVIHRGRGCKRLKDGDIALLNKLLRACPCGKHGKPNNPPDTPKPGMKPMGKSKGRGTCKSSS